MSFKTYKVQINYTATPSCAMTGTVNDQTSSQLIHKVEDDFVSSSNHLTSSPSSTPTLVCWDIQILVSLAMPQQIDTNTNCTVRASHPVHTSPFAMSFVWLSGSSVRVGALSPTWYPILHFKILHLLCNRYYIIHYIIIKYISLSVSTTSYIYLRTLYCLFTCICSTHLMELPQCGWSPQSSSTLCSFHPTQ